MTKKFIYLTLILVSALTITSCTSRRYGCPNSTGLKLQAPTPVQAAI
jgi:hypothetical protein